MEALTAGPPLMRLLSRLCALCCCLAAWSFSPALAASARWVTLPWQEPCAKHDLCRKMVSARARAAAACARDAGGAGVYAGGGAACAGVSPDAPALDCYSGGAALARFANCARAECLEVASFAVSAAACAEWFPRRRRAVRARVAAALAAVREGRGDEWLGNVSAPLAAAQRAAAAMLKTPLKK